jgi:hypothetical protein
MTNSHAAMRAVITAMLVAACTRDRPRTSDPQYLNVETPVVIPAERLNAERAQIGWVSLVPDSLVAWLENENAIERLCPNMGDATATARCRTDKLAPKALDVPLTDAPAADARPRGVLRITATPGKGLSFAFVNTTGAAQTFTPDLFLADWGYGPFAHQTYIARNDAWFELPADPFPWPVWLDTRALASTPNVQLLQPGDIVTMPAGDFTIVSVDSAAVVARAEQAGDMWCDEGAAPVVKAAPAKRFERSELYDLRGHLVVRLKYLKGC